MPSLSLIVVAVIGSGLQSTDLRQFGLAFEKGGIYVELPPNTALGRITRSDSADMLRFRSMDPDGRFGSMIVAYNVRRNKDLIPLPAELDLTTCTISSSGAVFRFYVARGEEDRRWATVSGPEVAMLFSSSAVMTADDVLGFMPEESWGPMPSSDEELVMCDRENPDAAYRIPRRRR